MVMKSTIDEEVEQVREFLLDKGYATKTIIIFSRCWRKLIEYTKANGYGSFSKSLGDEFLQSEFDKNNAELFSRRRKSLIRSVRLLESFLQSGDIAVCQSRCPSLPDEYRDVYNRYVNHLMSLGQQPQSLKTKKSRLRQFILYLSDNKIKSVKTLTKSDLLSFMDYLTKKYTSVGKANILYTIKDFLIFCKSENMICENISSIIKGIFTNPYENLPSVYSADEIKLILKTVNRSTAEGKKDYAILSLAAILGLRSSDIINIKLGDIKWPEKTIEFRQKKTGFYTCLPLPGNMATALTDYINNGRPVTEYENLFVRNRAPIAPYKEASIIFMIVSKYIKMSGVNIGSELSVRRNKGPHSLRHSMVSGLLENKAALPVIAAALGHKSTKNTNRYIRIDIELLRSVALEVPR
jgi:site-specific recombinase XerD